MTGLYISPLFIDSPCIKVITDIPPKPNIIAHRGASAVSLSIDSLMSAKFYYQGCATASNMFRNLINRLTTLRSCLECNEEHLL